MTSSTGGDGGRESLFAALKNIAATLLATGKTRAELFVTELEEEKYRLISLGAKAFGAAALLVIGVILFVACLAMLFWEQRVFVFGLFAALFLLSGLFLVRAMSREAREPTRLFRASLNEIDADISQLRGHDGTGAP